MRDSKAKWIWKLVSDASVLVWLWSLVPATMIAAITAWVSSRFGMPIWAVGLYVVCAFLLGAYFSILARKLISFWRMRRAWTRREFISIEEAGDIVSQVSASSSPARRHRRKWEIINELRGLIEDGRLPVANEKSNYNHIMETLSQDRLRLYLPKKADADTLIDKETFERVARDKNWTLPSIFDRS